MENTKVFLFTPECLSLAIFLIFESIHMDLDLLMSLYSVLFGLAFGSFMNVCIYRIPMGKSVIRPRSICPNCGKGIRIYDNIPLVSYLLLLGKCRHCRRPIPWHYPAVEALAGTLSLLLFIKYGLSYQYFFFFLFTGALVIIAFIDLHHKIIPDVLSLPGIIVGLTSSFILGHVYWLDSIMGIIGGGGTLFLVAVSYARLTGKEGMGGGDIKLMAMIGAWMGWRPLPLILLISSLTGAVIGFTFLILASKGFRTRIPFGPFLSLGALLYLFFGPEITAWYLSLLV
jgi:leader peptidase (prepilin peptidase)/N-methyltransferase